MQLDHGDIGVLYGNLVDNAVATVRVSCPLSMTLLQIFQRDGI